MYTASSLTMSSSCSVLIMSLMIVYGTGLPLVGIAAPPHDRGEGAEQMASGGRDRFDRLPLGLRLAQVLQSHPLAVQLVGHLPPAFRFVLADAVAGVRNGRCLVVAGFGVRWLHRHLHPRCAAEVVTFGVVDGVVAVGERPDDGDAVDGVSDDEHVHDRSLSYCRSTVDWLELT